MEPSHSESVVAPTKPKTWLDTLAQGVGHLSLAAALAFVAMFVFIRLAHEVARDQTRQFDTGVVGYFHQRQVPVLHEFMTAVSWAAGSTGMPLFVLCCAIGFTVARRFWPDALLLVLTTGGGLALIVALKAFFHRPRPYEVFAHLGYSFPSGHSFFAVTVYGMLAYRLASRHGATHRRTIWCTAIAAALLVGFSRVFLGEHFPSDVAAGYAVAVPWLWGCLTFSSLLISRHPRSNSGTIERS